MLGANSFECLFCNYLFCLFCVFVLCLRSKVDQIQDIVTGNPTVIKMVVSFNRGARGQNALRQLLAPVVKEIIEDKGLGINTSPVDIYKNWVNQLETQTGQARLEPNSSLTSCMPGSLAHNHNLMKNSVSYP